MVYYVHSTKSWMQSLWNVHRLILVIANIEGTPFPLTHPPPKSRGTPFPCVPIALHHSFFRNKDQEWPYILGGLTYALCRILNVLILQLEIYRKTLILTVSLYLKTIALEWLSTLRFPIISYFSVSKSFIPFMSFLVILFVISECIILLLFCIEIQWF